MPGFCVVENPSSGQAGRGSVFRTRAPGGGLADGIDPVEQLREIVVAGMSLPPGGCEQMFVHHDHQTFPST